MAFCTKCGTTILADDAVFCNSCGTPIASKTKRAVATVTSDSPAYNFGKRKRKHVLIWAGVVVVLAAIYMFSDANNAPLLGGQGYIFMESHPGTDVIVVRSKEAADAFAKASVHDDTIGIDQMRSSGEAWLEAYGTPVLCVESTMTMLGVRLLAGPNTGTVVWLPREWVHEKMPTAAATRRSVSTPSSAVPITSDNDGSLIAAVGSGNIGEVDRLLHAGASLQASEPDTGMPVLGVAARKGSVEIVRHLLDAGADVNRRDNAGATALWLAAYTGQVEVVKLLIGRGAEVDAEDRDGGTPLLGAVMGGQYRSMLILIEAGAQPDHRDHLGETPLGFASSLGNLPIARFLVEGGANVNNVSKCGAGPCQRTVLMTAADKNRPEIIRLLLENGADYKAVDNQGRTALMIARQEGNEAAANELALTNHRASFE